MRFRDRVRGRYGGGGMVAEARRWWSPQDRRTARMAAAFMVHEAPRMRAAAADLVSVGLVEGLATLQRAHNEWWQNATPEERAAHAHEALRRMPGQSYLFDEDE